MATHSTASLDSELKTCYQALLLDPSKTAGWPTLNLKSVFAASHPRVIRQLLHELAESDILFSLLQSHHALHKSIVSADHSPPESHYSNDAIGLTHAAKRHLANLWILCLIHGPETRFLRDGPDPGNFLVLDRSHTKYGEFIADHDFVEQARAWQCGAMIPMPIPEMDGDFSAQPEDGPNDESAQASIQGEYEFREYSFFQLDNEAQARQELWEDMSSDSTLVEVVSRSGEMYSCVEDGSVPLLRVVPEPRFLRRRAQRVR